jgi:phage pi2 protein 07
MAHFAEINVSLDNEAIRAHINQKLEEALHESLFTWDIDQMSKRTCMSKSFLEKEILCDPRMKLLERRKEKGKRYWFYKESKQVLKQILDEW